MNETNVSVLTQFLFGFSKYIITQIFPTEAFHRSSWETDALQTIDVGRHVNSKEKENINSQSNQVPRKEKDI